MGMGEVELVYGTTHLKFVIPVEEKLKTSVDTFKKLHSVIKTGNNFKIDISGQKYYKFNIDTQTILKSTIKFEKAKRL